MKQLFLRITLSFMLVFPFSLAYGFEFTNGKFIYQTLSDNSVGLCGLTFDDYDNVEELIVPSTVTYDGKSYMVTTIKSGGFLRDKLWQSGVKKVTIYSWINQNKPALKVDDEEISKSDIIALKKRIMELEEENEILKKATAIFAKRK